jgi:hypothetical protein
LALDKAQEYYAKLDDSAAYLAAIVLHPKYGWTYVEAVWANNKKWLDAGKKAVESLWVSSYKQQPVSEAISPQKPPSNHELNIMEAHRLKGLAGAKARARKATSRDEYEHYCSQPQVNTEYPLEWWRTVGSSNYPHLAQMAIDILSIPAMSDEPERIFSGLGHMITKRRTHLEQATTQAMQCLHSWDKAKIIDISK